MSLGDDLDIALPELREQAESRMTDTCVAHRAGGTRAYNPDTGKYETAELVVYPTPKHLAAGNPGKCRLQSRKAEAVDTESATAVFTTERVELQVPVGIDLRVDDVVTLVTAKFDPNIIGEKYRILGLARKSHATAQRFSIEVIL